MTSTARQGRHKGIPGGRVESPEHRKNAAREYFETQFRDESVVHLERVANERVFGREYDIWDVHTDRGRWWVISNPMNLYTQDDFKSMDVALSFHIGLTLRAFARFSPPAPEDEVRRFAESWRRVEQADDGLDHADEAEEFQAVGMQCREALLSFARELATDEIAPEGVERPKTGDFKGWAQLVARQIESRSRDRGARHLREGVCARLTS